ncbi:hypothetical protein BHM03_00057194 [Ensete ventricosum]|nr:hypothetical protein BHM03_00057194 [Ensete ventricosum]
MGRGKKSVTTSWSWRSSFTRGHGAIEDLAVGDLYVELVATFNLKRQMCSNLTVEEVIYAAYVDENGDGLLFQKSSNFHRQWVGVAGQCVHRVVDRLGLFLYGFFFRFKGFFR